MARYDGVGYGYRTEDYDSLDELYMSELKALRRDKEKHWLEPILGKEGREYYEKAFRVRTLIKEDFDKVFEKYDVILTPTTPNLPFKIGDSIKNPFECMGQDI